MNLPTSILCILLTAQLTVSSPSLELVRHFTKDTLFCPNYVTCSVFNAKQAGDNGCECSSGIGGTFLKYGDSFKCLRNLHDLTGKYIVIQFNVSYIRKLYF